MDIPDGMDTSIGLFGFVLGHFLERNPLQKKKKNAPNDRSHPAHHIVTVVVVAHLSVPTNGSLLLSWKFHQ